MARERDTVNSPKCLMENLEYIVAIRVMSTSIYIAHYRTEPLMHSMHQILLKQKTGHSVNSWTNS